MNVDFDGLYDPSSYQVMAAFVTTAPHQKPGAVQLTLAPSRSTISVTGPSTSLGSYKLDALDDIKALADGIIPSLVDLWIEIAPEVFTGVSVNFTPALTTLTRILELLELLSQHIVSMLRSCCAGCRLSFYASKVQKN